MIMSKTLVAYSVIPFCTSGGSGLGDARKNMEALGKGSNVVDGRRLSGNVSESELQDWTDQVYNRD
jgi:hypothetical protein